MTISREQTQNVVPIQRPMNECKEKKPLPRGTVAQEKRQAMVVVAILPEDREAALRVLAHARNLVMTFWTDE